MTSVAPNRSARRWPWTALLTVALVGALLASGTVAVSHRVALSRSRPRTPLRDSGATTRRASRSLRIAGVAGGQRGGAVRSDVADLSPKAA